MAQQRDKNRDGRRQPAPRRERNTQQGYTGQTGGQWGEDYHDTPYNTSGGYLNTGTNYDQGNYDFSQPDAYGFDRGNAYGQDRVNNDRNYGNDRRQQSSFPSDTYSGRNIGDGGVDQAYGESFGERRNAAYDEPRYRSGGSARDRDQRQNYNNTGQPAYTGYQQSRSSQPGYDHGHEYRNRQGQYEARQGGYPNRFGETSFGQEGSEGENYRGKGPRNYQRTDHRITEDVNDRLTDDHDVDASDIEVTVSGGEVVLSGVVSTRQAKRLAETITESVSGVRQVENRLRVRGAQEDRGASRETTGAKSTAETGKENPAGSKASGAGQAK